MSSRLPAARLARLGVALGVGGFVWAHAGPARAAAALASVPGAVYAGVIACFLLNTLIYAARVRLLLPAPHPSPGSIVGATLRGNFLGLALPMGGGEAAKVGFMAGPAGGFERALAAVVVARLLELLPWSLLVAWAGWGVLPERWPEAVPLARVAALLLGGAGVGGLAAAALGGTWAGRLPARLRAPVQRLADAGEQALRRHPWRALASLLLCVPFALLNVLAVHLVVRAHHLDGGYLDLAGLVPLGDIAIALPVSIGGVGVREAVFAAILAPLGAAPAVGVAVALARWSGDLARGLLGGLLLALEGGDRAKVSSARSDGG